MPPNPSPMPRPAAPPQGDVELLERLAAARADLLGQLARRIVGQHDVLDGILTAIFSGGHALLLGVPGLAKTLMVQTVAQALELKFSRIQFTPDLMPSDITGTEIIEEDQATGKRAFRFVRGPVFANIVLADEVNRTPPKTQAALLQAMQEHQVTAAGQTHPLPAPFFVLATQNPIEQEGTYPLPEAQLDRFMFELRVSYPSKDEEAAIVEATTGDLAATVAPVLTAEDVLALQHLVRRIPAAKTLVGAAVTLVRMTRPGDVEAPAFIKEFISWRAGGARHRGRAAQGRPVARALKSFLGLAALVACNAVLSVAPGPIAAGTWGGENAGLIATDSSAHVHIGCTAGDAKQALVADSAGRFDVPGLYNITLYPVARGPDHPARFFGWTDGHTMSLTVALTDTAVTLGPVQLTFGKEPRMGPCPICRRPGR